MTVGAEHSTDASSAAPSDKRRRALSIAAVLSAMALVVIDAAGTNLSLPSIARSLRIDASTAVLVVTTYQAAVVMALLPSAALGERFGLRRVFITGGFTFVGAACVAATAPALPWLLFARFVQGLGASAILALGVALLRASVSDRLLGAAIAWNAITVALASAAGPALAALVLSWFSWNWLYLFELPIGLFALMAARSLPLVEHSRQRLDLVSIGLNFAAFGLLVVGANVAVLQASTAALAIVFSILIFAALVVREAHRAQPLIPLDLLRGASFRTSILASIMCFIGQTAGLIALPFYLQGSVGLSAASAGLYMTAWPLSVAGAAFVSDRLSRWAGSGGLCAVGATLLASGMLGVAVLPFSASGLPVLLIMSGAGFGLFQVANNRNMFLAAPIARSGAAGGMQGTARLLGQAGGAALIAQLFTLAHMSIAPQLAMGVATVFALGAGGVSLFRAKAP